MKAREAEALDSTTKEHVDLFYNIFEEELSDTLERKKDLIQNSVITYSLLWTLFEPNEMVISNSDFPRGYLFPKASTKSPTGDLFLTCKYFEFTGKKFDYSEEVFLVNAFVGTKPIMSLPVYPLKYHPEKDAVRKTLIFQGKHWEEHKGYHYMQYDGLALGFSDYGLTKRLHVKSRIIIDAEAFSIFHSDVPIHVAGKDIAQELTDKQRMITSNMVYGYSLIDKEWLKFYLRNVSGIEWDSHAFESLVLPREQQDLKGSAFGSCQRPVQTAGQL